MTSIGTQPLRLVGNRTFRNYPGGREIERFRGAQVAQDDLCPEAWVGSDTRTLDADTCGDPYRGLAQYSAPEGGKAYLAELLQRHPVQMMGERHVQAFGAQLGLLVKLLDAQTQLGLQCHPDRADAMEYFGSPFGKLECWYVLSTRTDGESPYLLLGFKENITREDFHAHFMRGDIAAMENLCHKIVPQAGEMYFVDAGLPHAVGPGCFVLEVQEPSDITLGATQCVQETPEATAHFIKSTMNCYHYQGNSYEENLRKYRIDPVLLHEDEGGCDTLLLGQPHTDYFSVVRTTVRSDYAAGTQGAFAIAIIIQGGGSLSWEGGQMDVARGDELFLPADLKGARWHGSMQVILSYPPGVIRPCM